MPQKRRKYDTMESCDLATWAVERLDKLEPKLDKLILRMSMGMAGLAVIVFLAANGMLDLSKFNHPTADAAEVDHGIARK